ncbi:hypothetical protein TSACC_21735 [Terrimicrobium sacchariphilum]|uniref:Uncharacterized protein n=1 Tax=Terrimicrobium sacchariphilum TaxID=690879 RepID=A0A146G749_TERSA|nr:hypothetical protein [Terrimicrobium sacchariphilum]GAT33321.1 hypothetical protein TSACC_21735 [Terrimicrobium sacchariphilum]
MKLALIRKTALALALALTGTFLSGCINVERHTEPDTTTTVTRTSTAVPSSSTTVERTTTY